MQNSNLTSNSINNKKINSSSFSTIFSILTLLIACAGLFFAVLAYFKEDKPLTLIKNEPSVSAKFENSTIAEVAGKVAPSVVSIISETKTINGWRVRSGKNAGTGFLVSSDGLVITNKHVIEQASKLSVVLDNGELYNDVKMIGIDPLNDIGFIKIKNVKNLPAAKLGDSKQIAIGQPVIAIGNALGQYQNTVTQGIVSGTGRSVVASDESQSKQETLTDMIQTDASINPGNSGGPLVNAAGEVIGINTAVSNSAQGIGFAIPISAVKGMFKTVSTTGKLLRPYLGVYALNITPAVAKEYNLPVKSGAYLFSQSDRLSAIAKNSPAAKIGLKDKDIIAAINGTEIGRSGSLSTLIGEYAVGDTIQLRIIREQKSMDINLTLEAYSETVSDD